MKDSFAQRNLHVVEFGLPSHCFTIATHCNTLQHPTTPYTMQLTATPCNSPQHNATSCTQEISTSQNPVFLRTLLVDAVQGTATHCNTLQHNATHCNTLQHTATHCNTLQHTTKQCRDYNTLQHTATHCSTIQKVEAMVKECEGRLDSEMCMFLVCS